VTGEHSEDVDRCVVAYVWQVNTRRTLTAVSLHTFLIHFFSVLHYFTCRSTSSTHLWCCHWITPSGFMNSSTLMSGCSTSVNHLAWVCCQCNSFHLSLIF